MTADDLAALETAPENRSMLAILRDRGVFRPESAPWTLDDYELHCHPDLQERLAGLAEGLPGGGVMGLYGVPGLAANEVVYAVAIGTSTIHLRLPPGPVRIEIGALADRGLSEFGPAWVVADAWLSGLPSAEGTERLRTWLAAAAAGAVAIRA